MTSNRQYWVKRAQATQNRSNSVARARKAKASKARQAGKARKVKERNEKLFEKPVTRMETKGQSTPACSVLIHAISIGLVYPMHAGFNFPVGDAIAAQSIAHTNKRQDRRLICMLLRVPVLGEEWVKQIRCTEGSDIEALERVQKMLLDGNKHATGTLLYKQVLHAITHLYDGQVCWN
jgi:hypothetical protein